jgi:hypothetical protein
VAIPSPNFSSRGGAGVRLVVLHTAEGALTYQSLGNYFANPGSQVSSHTGIDDTPGVVGEYVRAADKAWTAANANPVAVQAELCAFAEWSAQQWADHDAMLDNAARWVAEECARFGIPIRRLSAAEAQGGAAGVCQHVDLGSWGGGHWDCGPGFPMDSVLARAGGVPGLPPSGAVPPPSTAGGAAPPWPGTLLVNYTEGHGTIDWQRQMSVRGWRIAVDDAYGDQSEGVCLDFQEEKGLDLDGVVGPETWRAAWELPIT